MTPNLVPIFELGVAEAYDLLVGRFGVDDLPPLDAIENEDWGRDLLLSRFLDIADDQLADAGLTLESRPPDAERHDSAD